MERWLPQLKSVLRSSPRLWPIVYRGLSLSQVPPDPPETILQRTREILSGAGVDVQAIWVEESPGVWHFNEKIFRHQLHHPTVWFWNSAGSRPEPLSTAGWRFLEQRLTRPEDRQSLLSATSIQAFNLLGAAGVSKCPDVLVRFLMDLIRERAPGETTKLNEALIEGGRAGVNWAALVDRVRSALDLQPGLKDGGGPSTKSACVFGTRVSGRNYLAAHHLFEQSDQFGEKAVRALRTHTLEEFREAALTSILVENEDILTREFLQEQCPLVAHLYDTAIKKEGLRGRLFSTGIFSNALQPTLEAWPRKHSLIWPECERFAQDGYRTGWAYIVDTDQARVEVHAGALQDFSTPSHASYRGFQRNTGTDTVPLIRLASVRFSDLREVSAVGLERWLAHIRARRDGLASVAPPPAIPIGDMPSS